ncbi:MAG: methyltransferase domain-containing protein [Candidatus Poribacteria bacterium]|nr:methyltransferase domain-containing protein [Candidatus Poribacteria bacterium]
MQLASAAELPYADQSFDLVVSIATLHNQYCYDLGLSLSETERVGKNINM